MNCFLGLPSSGKTTFSIIYSCLFNLFFIDFDSIIFLLYGFNTEYFFIIYNNNRIFRILENSLYLININYIISLGGGYIINYSNLFFLIKNIYLFLLVINNSLVFNRNLLLYYNNFLLLLERTIYYYFLFNIFLFND